MFKIYLIGAERSDEKLERGGAEGRRLEKLKLKNMLMKNNINFKMRPSVRIIENIYFFTFHLYVINKTSSYTLRHLASKF